MTAISLFDKQSARPRAASQPPVTDAQQLDEWLKRGKSEVFTVATMVSPDMARLLLSHNDANRNLNWTGATRSVAAYASAMKRGEWVLNGEPLIISRSCCSSAINWIVLPRPMSSARHAPRP